jgi:hypothetical protein
MPPPPKPLKEIFDKDELESKVVRLHLLSLFHQHSTGHAH